MAAAIAASCLLVGTSANAATASSTMVVQATVLTSCAIGTGALINFSYDPSSAAPTVANTGTSLTVLCNGGTTWSLFSTQAVATAIMQNTTIATATSMYQMPYGLFTDVGAVAALPITNVAGVITGVGTGLPQTPVIYAKLAPHLNVYAGTYAQTVNLTIVY